MCKNPLSGKVFSSLPLGGVEEWVVGGVGGGRSGWCGGVGGWGGGGGLVTVSSTIANTVIPPCNILVYL